jgi:methyl-accepting chemotaxis protein
VSVDFDLSDGKVSSAAAEGIAPGSAKKPSGNGKALALCAVAVLLPWAWGVWAVPLWVAGVSLVFSVISLCLIYYLMTSRVEAVRAQGEATHVQDRGDAATSEQSVVAMQRLLASWMESSQIAGSSIQHARASLDDVKQQSEVAAANIAKSFRVIMDKTGQQMDSAVKLLKSSSGDGSGSSAWLSLPDFITAYERQLDNVTGRMMDFSKASEEMSRHQDVVREHSLAIDEMLDELRTMAARIRKLALDSTVAANRDANADGRWFIEIADRIRETSTSAHELTRRMRDGLEKIREVMGGTYEELSKSSDNVRLAAVQAKVDVSQLNIATMEKAREVTATLEKITSLGKDVRSDINQIIIAMQYQDITQQKLEHIKAPLLAEAAASIENAASKTRAAGVIQIAKGAMDSGEQRVRVREDLAPGKAQKIDVELF